MKRFLLPMSFALCASLFTPAVQAHGIWLEMQHGALALVYGHAAESDAYDPAKVTGLALCDAAGGCAPLTWENRESHVALPMPEG